MIRIVTSWWLPLVMVYVAMPSDAAAQLVTRPVFQAVAQSGTVTQGELRGVVQDEHGTALPGAVVSALGSTTAFAIADREGRFLFRSLPYGPYLVRAHLQGYLPPRGRVVQVNGARPAWTIAMTRADGSASPAILAAGVGAVDAPAVPIAPADADDARHDHDEVAWRLRHSKRSVLKEAAARRPSEADGALAGDPARGLAQAIGDSARLASALFAELPLSGQINLLTATSFNRPQDLFSEDLDTPYSVAYLSLVVPASGGDWTMRGTLTQGDIASWILAGAYARRPGPDVHHQYEAGLSYSTQRYMGGNAQALNAVRDGGRNVGTMYAYDDWAVSSRVRVGYGAKYASYDYLADRSLLSPRVGVTVQPVRGDSLKIRAGVSRRETAPGAEEFIPPSTGLWLPPERTFSAVGRAEFARERLDHLEVSAEREWRGNVLVGVRAFRQRIDDQLVTLFGVETGGPAAIGHYLVGVAGDFEAAGWGVTVGRHVSDHLRASVDYSRSQTTAKGGVMSAARLASLAGSVLRDDEAIHDLTATVQAVLPVTSTRMLVIYKVNNAFADNLRTPGVGARFDVQVNQALPFMNFTNARWEMLVAVRNMFRDDLFGGSVYDEVLVVRPPTRLLAGVTVRF